MFLFVFYRCFEEGPTTYFSNVTYEAPCIDYMAKLISNFSLVLNRFGNIANDSEKITLLNESSPGNCTYMK